MRTCEYCDTTWDDDEEPCCPGCEAEYQRQDAFWRPLWLGERQAGLLRPEAERNQELRDAGRGHLVRDV